jgi:hypothetical protein
MNERIIYCPKCKQFLFKLLYDFSGTAGQEILCKRCSRGGIVKAIVKVETVDNEVKINYELLK